MFVVLHYLAHTGASRQSVVACQRRDGFAVQMHCSAYAAAIGLFTVLCVHGLACCGACGVAHVVGCWQLLCLQQQPARQHQGQTYNLPVSWLREACVCAEHMPASTAIYTEGAAVRCMQLRVRPMYIRIAFAFERMGMRQQDVLTLL
jgi:hypothetical protein